MKGWPVNHSEGSFARVRLGQGRGPCSPSSRAISAGSCPVGTHWVPVLHLSLEWEGDKGGGAHATASVFSSEEWAGCDIMRCEGARA